MDGLSVSIDEVRDMAGRFDTLKEDMGEIKTDGSSLRDSILEDWQSAAADKFSDYWDEIDSGILTEVVELLETVAIRLNETADAYEETDEALANL